MNDFSKRPVRLIGIGNPWRGDDGAGIILAEKIHKERIPGLEVILHQRDGASLIPLWHGIDRVIMVDAVCSERAAGKLLRFDLHREVFPETFFPVSTHVLGIAEALRIVKKLNQPLPSSFLLFGVTGERFEWGRELSFDMALIAERFIKTIKEELKTWAHPKEKAQCTKQR